MKDIYTPQDEAVGLAMERLGNEELQQRLKTVLADPPSPQQGQPQAMLARYIARGTNEEVVFAQQARATGFAPAVASYYGDAYTSANPEKADSVRPKFVYGSERRRPRIVAPSDRNGPIGDLTTVYGYSIREYYDQLRTRLDSSSTTFDVTGWYDFQARRTGWRGGLKAKFYYPALMASLAINVLYEDYDNGPNAYTLAGFRSGVVESAFEIAQELTGVRPLIVQFPYEPGFDEIQVNQLTRNEFGRLCTDGPSAIARDLV